jgi:alkanesulfonate monooxygenase SsuD/methylene tetrahydromethanopterin reductase-like flavin-dependent oxidoreductase (luciferase family)
MYFSGNSLNSAVFAARERLGVCLSFHKPQVVADTLATYRAEAARAGWEPTADHIVYRGFALVADTDERAAQLEAVFLPPPLRFLLEGPVPPAGAFGSTGAQHAHSPESIPAPFGQGRMLFAGTPDTVVERIRSFHQTTGVGVIDLVFGSGQIPAEDVQRSVELFGREVLPRIRDFGASPTSVNAVAAASA